VDLPRNVVNIQGQVHITPSNHSVCNDINTLDGNFHCGESPNPQPGDGGSITSAASSGGGGLSTGAKAGIGVGAGVGGLLIILAVLFFVFRSRSRNNRNPRSAAAGDYPISEQKNIERSPVRYSKVPATSESPDTPSGHDPSPISQRPVSEPLADDWSPPGQSIPSPEGRVELEEQQLPRHEMDARSLPDMDMDDDEEETRSLQDIERVHGQR
jgi:hypothetical protein